MTYNCRDCKHFCMKPIFEIDAETHIPKKVAEVDGCKGNGQFIGITDISTRKQACALFKPMNGTIEKEATALEQGFAKEKGLISTDNKVKNALKRKTVKQLQAECTEKGIEFAKKDTKAKLIAKLG